MSAEQATLADKVRESRREQGLPEKVEDPAVLARVAALLRRTTDEPFSARKAGAA